MKKERNELPKRKHPRLKEYDYTLPVPYFVTICTNEKTPYFTSGPLARQVPAVTRVAWKHGVEGRIWQKSFHEHVLRKEESIVKVAEYILANPVRRGLVASYSEYPYSGTPAWEEEA